MSSFDVVLAKIRSDTEGEMKKRGDRFEHLMKTYLETDSV